MNRKFGGRLGTYSAFAAALSSMAIAPAYANDFTLELLHFADQEAKAEAIVDAPNLSAVLNGLKAQDLGNDGVADNTLILSSGDAFIPSPFFSASDPVFGTEGIADIQIQNELGVQAIALGNHEFDKNTELLAKLIDGSASGDFSALVNSTLKGADFEGTTFPYLSSNLDFSTDTNLAPLAEVGKLAASTVLIVGGQKIGVVGATTDDDINIA